MVRYNQTVVGIIALIIGISVNSAIAAIAGAVTAGFAVYAICVSISKMKDTGNGSDKGRKKHSSKSKKKKRG